MADLLRARLDRLQDLAKRVNAASDDTGRIVQGVESYLNSVIHLGVSAEVLIDSSDHPEESYSAETALVYGRHGPKFRIYVRETVDHQDQHSQEVTLWANCTRELKLLAFRYLADLLAALEKSLEETLELVKANTETIQALLPIPAKGKAAKS